MVASNGSMEVLGDQRCDMVSCKSHRCCSLSGTVPRVALLTVLLEQLMVPQVSGTPKGVLF